MFGALYNTPILGGGLTIGILVTINIFVVRYILAVLRENREEYSRRLTKAVIELEMQKTINIRLEIEIERLKK